jgi:hypothetical protein
MNYDFYADKIDKLEILEYIFDETDLRVFDLGSIPGERICEYTSANEINEKFDLENGGSNSLTFQLWTSRFKAQPVFRKIELNPKNSKEPTFRYSTDGWGLIQLYFGGIKNQELNRSHIGHFNEKGALKLEGINLVNGKVSNWDWKEIEVTSRKLKYQIHNRLTVKKLGSFGILNGADKLEKQGIKLR